MIEVTRLDNSSIFVNVDMIQSLEATPDTVITFTSREKMMVKEPVDEVYKRVFKYRKLVQSGELFDRNSNEQLLFDPVFQAS